jgi:hypothetical protein
MGRREDLLRAEAEGWAELVSLLARVPQARLGVPGLNEAGWSVADLVWHLAFWCSDAAEALGRMRDGTFDRGAEPDGPAEVDPINDAQLERSREMPVAEISRALPGARAAMLERFGELESPTADADEWFDESGPLHYAQHLPALRAWVGVLAADG